MRCFLLRNHRPFKISFVMFMSSMAVMDISAQRPTAEDTSLLVMRQLLQQSMINGQTFLRTRPLVARPPSWMTVRCAALTTAAVSHFESLPVKRCIFLFIFITTNKNVVLTQTCSAPHIKIKSKCSAQQIERGGGVSRRPFFLVSP